MNDIARLQDAIRQLHSCNSIHMESVSITEMFRGAVAWDGVVETFELFGHPDADRCYAWMYLNDDDSTQFVVILHNPPIDSPLKAVKAAIAASAKSRKPQ